MPNKNFQFKQFLIQQDKSAMKVTTDACLFGAVAANEIKNSYQSILDIGSGTGLLSLMIAQKNNAFIDAVEIDKAAFEQTAENFEQSPWKERLAIFNENILEFAPAKKYGCIISNPPFYEKYLKSPDDKINAARHDDTLTLDELIKIVDTNLSADGIFAVLLPFSRNTKCLEIADKHSLYCFKNILIKQTPAHNYFRSILFFCRDKKEIIQYEVIIKDEKGNYTERFIEQMKDYYLYL